MGPPTTKSLSLRDSGGWGPTKALAGPLGKIIREHFQNLAVHRETMQCEAMCSIYSLAGLFTQGQSHCEDDCQSGLEAKLSSGTYIQEASKGTIFKIKGDI